MTRKDYLLITQAITTARYGSGHATNPIYQAGLDILSSELATLLGAKNPLFDESKFLSAAQFGKLPRESEVA